METPSSTKSARETQELAGRISKGLEGVSKKKNFGIDLKPETVAETTRLANEAKARLDEDRKRRGIALHDPDKLKK